jgi:hypothetical protein
MLIEHKDQAIGSGVKHASVAAFLSECVLAVWGLQY